MPFVIGGVVVVLVAVGGFCLYKRSKGKEEAKEGGKALFKTQIKNNKPHKEQLV